MKSTMLWCSGALFGLGLSLLVYGLLWQGAVMLFQSIATLAAGMRVRPARRLATPLLFVALCLVASPASAGRIWTGTLTIPAPRETHTFRVAFNENAWLEHVWASTAGEQDLNFPGDSPNVDAFIAELTDGETDMLTWSSPYFSHTIAENAFFSQATVPAMFHGSARPIVSPSAPDLQFFTISEIALFASDGGYDVFVRGAAPEPASGLLFLIGLCGVGLHRKH